MYQLNILKLLEISTPIIKKFKKIELKKWDRITLLTEFQCELGSLAHHVQIIDKYKKGKLNFSGIADECSDILFILFRLALEDRILLPHSAKIQTQSEERNADCILKIADYFSMLMKASDNGEIYLGIITNIIRIALSANIDIEKAYELEMQIADLYFAACGINGWPKLKLFKYPISVFKLFILLKKRKNVKFYKL